MISDARGNHVSPGIYTEENMDKIAPIMVDLNKRLMIK